MKILHGTWIPNAEASFIQTGAFYLWVETPVTKKRSRSDRLHPNHLAKADLLAFLVQELGIKQASDSQLAERISLKYFALPTAGNHPLPSPELTKYLESETLEDYEAFQYWEIDCYEVTTIVKSGYYNYQKVINVTKLLNDIHFLALYNTAEIQIGSDLLFWYYYTQSFKQVIFKDQYIPALKYREIPVSKRKSKSPANSFEIYSIWEIVSEQYELKRSKVYRTDATSLYRWFYHS